MNPNIAHDLMQARIADLHRPPGRLSTGNRKHAAIWRTCWCVIALVAGAMVFLAGAPAALAVHVPPPGDTGGAQLAPPPVLPAPAGGTPGWQIALIAVGSALAACALTLLAVRTTRRATAAQPTHP
jgi:hypothetical protein